MYRKYLIKGIALAFAFSLIVFNSGCSSGIGEPKLDESNSKISSSDTRTQSTSQLNRSIFRRWCPNENNG